MSLILTIDLGTTLFKIALFDEAGNARQLVTIPPPIERPLPQRCQINPDRFKRSVAVGISTLRDQVHDNFAQIKAICFSTQANSFTLLDHQQRPLCPIILWPDARAKDCDLDLQAFASDSSFRDETGIPQLSHEFALAKLLWMQRQEPGLWQDVRTVCFLSDYLTLWLTGTLCVEAGVAGLSGGVNIRQQRWRDAFANALRLNSSALPSILRAGTDLGPIRSDVAAELGLPPACRFIVGCLDQYAGAIGTGSVRPDMVTETTGTVLAVVRCADRLTDVFADSVFHGPGFAPDRFWQMSFSNNSANLLDWYRQQLPESLSLSELNHLAEREPDGSAPLTIAPSTTPSTASSTMLSQIRPEHTRGQVIRAIMKCVAISLRDQVQLLCDGHVPPAIRSAGGGARSNLWMQIKANTLGTTFCRHKCDEPTSLGAAMLAANALGWGSLQELADRWVAIGEEFYPG